MRSHGTLIRDYIYVRDVVSAYMLLGEALEGGEHPDEAFNFSCESRVTVLAIAHKIARLCDSKLEPQSRADAQLEIHDQTLSAHEAHLQLGWTPAWTLDDGLTETIAWYRNHLRNVKPPVLVAARQKRVAGCDATPAELREKPPNIIEPRTNIDRSIRRSMRRPFPADFSTHASFIRSSMLRSTSG